MESHYLFTVICLLTCAFCDGYVLKLDNTTTTEETKGPNLVRNKREYSPYNRDVFEVKKYGIYLIAITMLIMMIAIICLAIALYMAIKKKWIFHINQVNNKEYVRQESAVVTHLLPCSNSSDYAENINNGSTLTVNSDSLEINRISEPETPIRIDNSKIIFAKKPFRTPVAITRGQMEEICTAVLNKVKKSDSASFRELNDFIKVKSEEKQESNLELLNKIEQLKKKTDKKEVQEEPTYDKVAETSIYLNSEEITDLKSEQKNSPKPVKKIGPKVEPKPNLKLGPTSNLMSESKIEEKSELKLESKPEVKTEIKLELKPEVITDTKLEGKTETKIESKPEVKTETKHELKSETKPEVKTETINEIDNEVTYDVCSEVKIKVNNVEDASLMTEDSDAETEYDTVPNPIRFRPSGVGSDDFDIDNIYDLPPRRSYEGPSRVVQMDNDSQYLLPLSMEQLDSGYINARRVSHHST